MGTTIEDKPLQGALSCALAPPALPLPLIGGRVAAGFPSPAEDYIEKQLDLNNLLVRHAQSTYFMKVKGDSMIGERIFDGDMLVIDRSITPRNAMVVVAVVNSEILVKKLYMRGGQVKLKSANPAYPDMAIKDDIDLVIWGVVTGVIRQR